MPRGRTKKSKGPFSRQAGLETLCPEGCAAKTALSTYEPRFPSIMERFECPNGHGHWQLRRTWRSTFTWRPQEIFRDLLAGRSLPAGAVFAVAKQCRFPEAEFHRLVGEQRLRGPWNRERGARAMRAALTECLECGTPTVQRTEYAIHRGECRIYTCRKGHGSWEILKTWRTRVVLKDIAECHGMTRHKQRSGMIRELVYRIDSNPDLGAAVASAARWLSWSPDKVRDALERLRQGITTEVLTPGQVGRLLGIGAYTPNGWEKKGVCPLAVKVGSQRRWSLEEVIGFVAYASAPVVAMPEAALGN